MKRAVATRLEAQAPEKATQPTGRLHLRKLRRLLLASSPSAGFFSSDSFTPGPMVLDLPMGRTWGGVPPGVMGVMGGVPEGAAAGAALTGAGLSVAVPSGTGAAGPVFSSAINTSPVAEEQKLRTRLKEQILAWGEDVSTRGRAGREPTLRAHGLQQCARGDGVAGGRPVAVVGEIGSLPGGAQGCGEVQERDVLLRGDRA